MGAEEKADRAAKKLVDLVEQEVQHPTSQTTETRLSPDMHISAQTIATNEAERLLEHTGQEEGAIPEWLITESRMMSREVTPPARIFSGTMGNDMTETVGRW
jgi:hypothetical protein